MDSDDHDYVIIGGGVAGLVVLNRLADLGIQATLIEAGDFPSHKICGEFFSFECHEFLENWGVLPSQQIKDVNYHIGDKTFHFSLPIPARGGSRYLFDEALYRRAIGKGMTAYLNTRVEEIDFSGDTYQIILSNRKILRAKKLFIGTGRVFSLLEKQAPPKMRYRGFKAHFEGISSQSLEMVITQGGYLGLSPVDNDQTNLACIAEINAIKGAGSIDQYLANQEGYVPEILGKARSVFGGWLEIELPEIQMFKKSTHSYKNLYLIGDAAASIAPASGDGLAMAVQSGMLAVDYSLKGEEKRYQQHLTHLYRKRLRWARRIHQLMLRPVLIQMSLFICYNNPWLFNYLFYCTRGKKETNDYSINTSSIL